MFAPRIAPRLLEALRRLDDGTVSYAELTRRVGREAERLGVPRPSYQRVRVLAHAWRALRRRRRRSPRGLELSVGARFVLSLGVRSEPTGGHRAPHGAPARDRDTVLRA